MFFGHGGSVGAHEERHPLLPRRDRDLDVGRSKAPPVPRAPRAPRRSQSSGALAREAKLVEMQIASEQLRPQEVGSSFTHARVSVLARERHAMENQRFEMGPLRSDAAVLRQDFKRGHVLGHELESNIGVPLGPVDRLAPAPGPRRSTLLQELKAADQALEWVPKLACCQSNSADGFVYKPGDHARVNTLSREKLASDETREWALGVRPLQLPAIDGARGRRSMLLREEQTRAPASKVGDSGSSGVPYFGRKRYVAQ
mmetsp:Transcript_7373/g.15305  ORF Transcript_7373/g.15305 Transcript_7373/m.15305 type:complete len:257 (-) Transcript_7373:51-821(-)